MGFAARIVGAASAALLLGSAIAAGEEAPARADPGPAASAGLGGFFRAPFVDREDPDGPINTDRPSFTPSNFVVPRGRVQVESGYSFAHDLSRETRVDAHDFPELAVRVGLTDRVEFRTFWLGQTYSREVSRLDGRSTNVDGPSDMEIGFKSQLTRGEADRPWRPTSALITSALAPTGGTSPYSSGTVLPNVFLLYGWKVGERWTLAGSTGITGIRLRTAALGVRNSLRFSQSVIAFYDLTPRTTLFHEWYAFNFLEIDDDRPTHFMDSGLTHRPTPNTQLDLRAGFGLSDRSTDLIAGAGFSIRF